MDKEGIIYSLKNLHKRGELSDTVAIGFDSEDDLSTVCSLLDSTEVSYSQTGNALIVPRYVKTLLHGSMDTYEIPFRSGDTTELIKELSEAKKSRYHKE